MRSNISRALGDTVVDLEGNLRLNRLRLWTGVLMKGWCTTESSGIVHFLWLHCEPIILANVLAAMLDLVEWAHRRTFQVAGNLPAIMSAWSPLTTVSPPMSWGGCWIRTSWNHVRSFFAIRIDRNNDKQPFITVCQCTPHMTFPAQTISHVESINEDKCRTLASLQMRRVAREHGGGSHGASHSRIWLRWRKIPIPHRHSGRALSLPGCSGSNLQSAEMRSAQGDTAQLTGDFGIANDHSIVHITN